MITEQIVLKALKSVTDPQLDTSVVDLGMVREIVIHGNTVEVKMALTAPFCPLANYVTARALEAVAALPGVKEATVEILGDLCN